MSFVGLFSSTYLMRSLDDFRPGAFGFPARGESSFALRTLWSSSAFGTFRIFRMMPLNFLNSGVSRNCSGVSGGSTASQEPAQSAFQSLTPTTTPWGYLSERDTQHGGLVNQEYNARSLLTTAFKGKRRVSGNSPSDSHIPASERTFTCQPRRVGW